ncbi:hypothetical protein BC30048_p1296 (plasmid) [Bacillus cereus]|uniref:hypothetical protein n=1 Tax=Bacillus cereus TaxID=1396 RepID=UPI001F1F2B6B|nr:hypothetical protein [Bacillus cereus]BCD02787.1 hypothetical protein BC30048_p1296 [Bacillus cereus]
MGFYRLKLDVELDKNKVTERKFYKIVDKFFNKLGTLTGKKSPEKKLSFNIAERKLTIDISVVIEEKIFLRFKIIQID